MKKTKIADKDFRSNHSKNKHHSHKKSKHDSSSSKHHSKSSSKHEFCSDEESSKKITCKYTCEFDSDSHAETKINIDNNQSNKASITQSNTFIFVVGGKKTPAHTTIKSLGELYKIDINESGEVSFNGVKMEPKELGEGLKGFVIRQNKVITNDD